MRLYHLNSHFESRETRTEIRTRISHRQTRVSAPRVSRQNPTPLPNRTRQTHGNKRSNPQTASFLKSLLQTPSRPGHRSRNHPPDHAIFHRNDQTSASRRVSDILISWNESELFESIQKHYWLTLLCSAEIG